MTEVKELTPREASLLAVLAFSPNTATFDRIKDRLGEEDALPIGLAIMNSNAKVSKTHRAAAQSIMDWAERTRRYDSTRTK